MELEELCKACYYGNIEKVKKYFRDGGFDEIHFDPITIKYSDGNIVFGTPIEHASFSGQLNVLKYLFDINFEDNETMERFYNLYFPIRNGHLHIVKFLIQNGISVNSDEGMSPLSYAIIENQFDIVKYLVENGANIFIETDNSSPDYFSHLVESLTEFDDNFKYDHDDDYDHSDENNMLCLAIKKGNLKILKYLCDKVNCVERVNNKGYAPLYYACQEGHFEIVDYLIKRGAHPDYGGGILNPIIIAIEKGFLKIVYYLIDKGANINVGDVTTVLGYACMKKYIKLAKYLIEEKNANVDKKSPEKPIDYAIMHKDLKFLKYLVNHGANVDEDRKENSPLYCACRTGNFEIVKYLVENGANVNRNKYYSPIVAAVRKGFFKIAYYLIEKGGNVNIDLEISVSNCLTNLNTNYETSVLGYACKKGNLNFVKYLIEKKNADINGGLIKETPIACAVTNEHFQIVKYLIDKNVDLNKRTEINKYMIRDDNFYCGENLKKVIALLGGSSNNYENLNLFSLVYQRRHFEIAKCLLETNLKKYEHHPILSKNYLCENSEENYSIKNNEEIQDQENNKLKKASEKWLELPNDIWFYILNEFFDYRFEKTCTFFKLSQISKQFHNDLLTFDTIMNNFNFSLKEDINPNLKPLFEKVKPSYKIKSLSFIYNQPIATNINLQFIENSNYFNLYKLDISFCSHLNDESFQYFKNIKVLDMVGCNQKTITNKGLSKLKKITILNMTRCNQPTITDKAFQLMNTNELKKLNISCCTQFNNHIFEYLPNDCKVKTNQLNLNKSDKKRKLEKEINTSNKSLKRI
jgi:ankyrin repeat protein